MKENKQASFIAFGLLIGSIVGLFLDMYQFELFGAVGLGIVYAPVLGLLLSVFAYQLMYKKVKSE